MQNVFTQDPMLIAGAAFLLGWIVAKIAAFLGRKLTDGDRDPRDTRIRSLSADVRVAQSMAEKAARQLAGKEQELAEAVKTVKTRSGIIDGQEEIIARLRTDLKDSVQKTRELREELTERATDDVKSSLRLRELETELSVARASNDLIETGMLDYSSTDDGNDRPSVNVGGRSLR